MPISITIPRLGWNMEEGIFSGWLHADGAAIRAGDMLFTLESEKATEEVETLDGGTLRIPPDGPKEGDTLPVGTVIGYLLEAGEAAPWESSAPVASPAKPSPAAPAKEPCALERAAASPSASSTVLLEAPAISPRAKRVAGELGVDWTLLEGTGSTGRIRERDVRAAASSPAACAASKPVAPARSAAAAEELQPISVMRRTIADRMLASHLAAAPVTLTTTADATNLVGLRTQFKNAGDPSAVVPSFNDILAKLSALALERHPRMTGQWTEAGIRQPAGIHIGIAVDTEAGLLVPVVRDVPTLGLRQLAARSRDLIERARVRRLTTEEMQGGVFTITNLGGFGIDAFTPILNAPECAILGVGRIERRAVVRGEAIVPCEQVTLSLTFDHRVVDGAPAARFLQALVAMIENPSPWLMS